MTPYSDECHRIIPGAWWAASEVRFPVTCMTVKLVRYWILDIHIGFYSEYQLDIFGIGMSNIGLYSEYQCCFFGIGMSNTQHFCKRQTITVQTYVNVQCPISTEARFFTEISIEFLFYFFYSVVLLAIQKINKTATPKTQEGQICTKDQQNKRTTDYSTTILAFKLQLINSCSTCI